MHLHRGLSTFDHEGSGPDANYDPAHDDEDFDPDRLVGCAYWRCDEIFEQRTSNHRFCRKACRSRQRKWERSVERKRAKQAQKQLRRSRPTLLLRLAILAFGAVAVVGCSSSPSAAPEPTPTAGTTPGPNPTSGLVVSDAVPSLQELQDLGLGEKQAQCFIDTIDPEGTGKVADADAFMEAWVTCL